MDDGDTVLCQLKAPQKTRFGLSVCLQLLLLILLSLFQAKSGDGGSGGWMAR